MPITRQQFADFFFADDAPCWELDWHKVREGDKEMEWSEWSELNDQPGVFTRDTSFKTPIVGAPFGPPETRVHKVERLSNPTNGPLILHSFATTPDVPFGELFYMYSRWTVVDIAESKCKITFEAQMVVFKQTFAFRAVKGIVHLHHRLVDH
jgi:hypothetical protein